MGSIKKRENFDYSEKYILDVLNKHFFSKNSLKYLINNLYFFNWESDYLAITKSGYLYEIEVKISKNDYKKDFEKKDKHLILENTLNNNINGIIPNYFYYAVPYGLIDISDVPNYAGLIYINNNVFPYFKIIKNAPKIVAEKTDLTKLNLADKFYYNMWTWKNKAENEYPNIINDLKNQLDEAKTDENGKKYKYTLAEANKRIDLLNDEISLKEKYIEYYNDEYNQIRSENRRLKKILTENNIKYE